MATVRDLTGGGGGGGGYSRTKSIKSTSLTGVPISKRKRRVRSDSDVEKRLPSSSGAEQVGIGGTTASTLQYRF